MQRWIDLHNKKQPVYFSGKPDEGIPDYEKKGKSFFYREVVWTRFRIWFISIPFEKVKKIFRRIFR